MLILCVFQNWKSIKSPITVRHFSFKVLEFSFLYIPGVSNVSFVLQGVTINVIFAANLFTFLLLMKLRLLYLS